MERAELVPNAIERVQNILGLCIKLNSKPEYDVYCDYYGQVNSLEVRMYKVKYKPVKEILNKSAYLKRSRQGGVWGSFDEFEKEVTETINKLLNEKKIDSHD